MTLRDLTPLLRPRAVAVVGASADPMAWGSWFVATMTAEDGAPEVVLVNRRGGEIGGRTVYRSLAETPAHVDLAVLAIPAAGIPDAIEQGLARGVRAFVVVAAGFGELSPEGATDERRLARRVRGAGGVLVGPNCMGFFEASSNLNVIGNVVPRGPIAFVAQSGNLAVELGGLLETHSLGFSRLVSLGNAADLDVADVIDSVAEHEPTRVACCYVEDTRGGERLLAAIRRTSARKPVLVLAVGRSAVGAAAAASHTGALASDWRVFAAALGDAGARIVLSMGELADAAAALALQGESRGRRLGVMSDGGGNSSIAADLAADAGLALPPLDARVHERLVAEIPTGRAANPVDLAGAGERDILSFARIGEAILDDPGLDVLLLTGYFGGYGEKAAEIAAIEEQTAIRLAGSARAAGKPLVVHSMHSLDLPGLAAFRGAGVPVYTRLTHAIDAIDALAPRIAAPIGKPGAAPTALLPRRPTYADARALLADCGIPLAEGRLVATPEEVETAIRAFGPGARAALKVVGPDLLHKTDVGAVELDVDPEGARSAAARGLGRVLAQRPGTVIDGVFVERMATPGLDLIVGAKRDPSFGPTVLVGVGGIFAEAFDDVAIAVAPATVEHVVALLGRLRAAPLLAGARGRAPVDVLAVARVAVALGDVLHGRPEIAEIEVNPIRVAGDDVIALDARIVIGSPSVPRTQPEVPEWRPEDHHSLTSSAERA